MDLIYKDFLFIDFGGSTKAWLEMLAGLPRGEIYWNTVFEISVLLCYMTWGNPPPPRGKLAVLFLNYNQLILRSHYENKQKDSMLSLQAGIYITNVNNV